MASGRPPTFASLTYALRAATYILMHLARDGRVLGWWSAWCLTRGLDPVALRAWRVQLTRGGDRTALDAALAADREATIAKLTILCRDGLGLDLVWLPFALHDCFRLWVEDIVDGRLDRGQERRVLGYRLTDDWRTMLPPGKSHDLCERDVSWFYRARVKQPPDHLEDISREASPAARRDKTKRSSTPHEAVKRVQLALSSLTIDDTVPRPTPVE